MKVQIVNDSMNPLPKYATDSSSGVDLMADFSLGMKEEFFECAAYDEVSDSILIFTGGRALIPTNIRVSIPKGFEIQIRPRSGLALKHGISVLNTPGTIDSDYTGQIGVILINFSDEVFSIKQGDRIAQAVLNKVSLIEWEEVSTLTNTKRGDGGFGHTGIKGK